MFLVPSLGIKTFSNMSHNHFLFLILLVYLFIYDLPIFLERLLGVGTGDTNGEYLLPILLSNLSFALFFYTTLHLR